MTHPADARAGWHFPVGSLKLALDPIAPVEGEFRFDALHWALAAWRPACAGWHILERVTFEASAVLRAPAPRPMVHGLWLQLYDGRCRNQVPGWPWAESRICMDDILDAYFGEPTSQASRGGA